MDPNQTLKMIREMINAHEHGEPFDVDDFVEVVAALDSWITRGGLLPRSWEVKYRMKLGQ